MLDEHRKKSIVEESAIHTKSMVLNFKKDLYRQNVIVHDQRKHEASLIREEIFEEKQRKKSKEIQSKEKKFKKNFF